MSILSFNFEVYLYIHILISLLYSVLYIKKGMKEVLCRFLIVLFFPFAGLLFFLIIHLFELFSKKDEEIDYSELSTRYGQKYEL